MAADHVPSIPHPVRLLRRPPPSPHRSRPRLGNPVFEPAGRPALGGTTWLWVRTDLDVTTAARARRELSAIVRPGRNPGSVLVYLGPECFVDVRGLRLLIETAERVRSCGGALAVVAPPRCLERLVQLSQLGAQLPLVATARQATWWVRTRGTGLR